MKLLIVLALVGAAWCLPTGEAPLPVEDTPEVAAAKAEFQVAYDAAAAAAEAGAVPEVVDPVGAPEAVVDTDDVAAAKAAFQAEFERVAAAAEAAPDFDLDGKLSTYSGYLSTLNGRLSPHFTNTFPYGAYGLHAPVLAAGAPLTYTGLAHGAPLTYTGLGYTGLGYPGVFGAYPYVVKA